MPLYESLDDTPYEYVLARQRAESFKGVQSVFGLRAMTHRETQKYFTRRSSELENRRNPADIAAGKASTVDEETLRAVLTFARNIYEDGDDLSTPDKIGELVTRLSWGDMQELLTAASNRGVLEEGSKNS